MVRTVARMPAAQVEGEHHFHAKPSEFHLRRAHGAKSSWVYRIAVLVIEVPNVSFRASTASKPSGNLLPTFVKRSRGMSRFEAK